MFYSLNIYLYNNYKANHLLKLTVDWMTNAFDNPTFLILYHFSKIINLVFFKICCYPTYFYDYYEHSF